MHELSIADAVREIVERNAGDRRVVAVDIQVGHLRQVVPESLQFAWELVTQGTAIDGAELRIDYVPARARCQACDGVSGLRAFPAQCGACGSLDVDVTGGDELLVDSLEIEEELMTRTGG